MSEGGGLGTVGGLPGVSPTPKIAFCELANTVKHS